MKKFSKAHFSKAQRKLDKKISLEELDNISGGSEELQRSIFRRDPPELMGRPKHMFVRR